MNVDLNEKIYYRGTIIEATYEWETGVEIHQSILAESFDEGFAFQVIQINGHDAGEIESMIHLQFEDVGAVSFPFLQDELSKQRYRKISDLKIISAEHSETIKEYMEFHSCHNSLKPYKAK